MSANAYPFRDPEGTAPALGWAQSFWALLQRSERALEHSLERACAEGCRFLEAGLSAERMPVLRNLIQRFPLRLIAQGWATTANEADAFLDRAAELGAVCINFHLGHAFLSVPQAVDLIGEVQGKAEAYGLPMLLETHRGRLTQDLLRTAEVVAQLPDLRLTLDVSHYLVAGEGVGGHEASFHEAMRPLLQRASLVHGRVSDGQSVQVRSADRLAFTTLTQELWLEAMRCWLANAPPDALFLFEPELGPPPYAVRDPDGKELFNRTEETYSLMRLAETGWIAAHHPSPAANDRPGSERCRA